MLLRKVILLFALTLVIIPIITVSSYASDKTISLETMILDPDGEYEASAMASSEDGGYYLVGTYSHNGTYANWVRKTDPKGNVLWTIGFKASEVEGVAIAKGGIIVLGANFVYRPEIGYRPWIMFIKESGEISYTRELGVYAIASGITRSRFNDDSYYVFGTKDREGLSKDEEAEAWVCKIDSRGKIIWEQLHGKGGEEFVQAVIELSDGNIVFEGISGKFNKFGQGPSTLWIALLDNKGKLLKETQVKEGRLMSASGGTIASSKNLIGLFRHQLTPSFTLEASVSISIFAREFNFKSHTPEVYVVK